MSVLCGRPTPTGPCQRKVRAPGEPCGANHPRPVSAAPPPLVTAAAGPDPLAPPQAHTALGAVGAIGIGRRRQLAEDASTSPDVLDALADNADAATKSAVAENPSTPPATLARLVDDSHWAVRMGAATNPNTPPEAVARLTEDADPAVRTAAEAALPGTAPDRVAELAQDDRWLIRYRVAWRDDLPVDVLISLANDWDRKVREAARSNPAFTGPVAAHAGLLAD